jgi:IAA-amino acid hydrolase
MLDRARSIANQIVQWRRHIHRHPELSFQEFETARFIAQALRDMGIDVQTGVGKTGVVGRLGNGKPVIALRADMDALPVLEETGLSFSSVNEGVMHACGHDTHVACLLGAAKLLAETPPERGEVRFLFQPSEETVDDEEWSGAMRMADEGAIDGVDAVFGLHNWPEIEVGKVALSAGPQMASAGKFTARIRGRGGHGASPHQTVDPVVLAAQAVLALQTIVSRRLDPIDTGVVTVGSIHGGTRDNIIPEYVDLVGTLRSLRTEVYEQLKREVTRALGIARALGGDFEVEFHKSFPVTYNDSQMTALVTEVAQEMLGAEQVLPAEPTMGGEDFSVFAQRVPGCFLRLGAGFPGQPLRNHHDPHFDVDESALPIGAAMLAQVAVRYLSNSE